MPLSNRAQRLATAEATARDKLAVQRKALATIQAQQRAAAKKARAQRRYQVGTLVDEAGLAGIDDAVLRPLLALLQGVASVPDPVALLEALLMNVGNMPGKSMNGLVHRNEESTHHGITEAARDIGSS
jgi:hypothetical protein